MIYIGSDHAGYTLKEEIKKFLESLGYEFIDVGTDSIEPADYPDYAKKVVDGVLDNPENRGIMICGTGIGSCIAANRHKSIRAALPYNEETARLSREHNNANILCLGGRTMDKELAKKMTRIWLETPFSEAERHVRRLKKIEEYGT